MADPWDSDPNSFLTGSDIAQLQADILRQAGHSLLYHNAYIELAKAVTGRDPKPEPPDEKDFIKTLEKYLEENRERAYEAICIKFDYCKRRKKWGDSWPLFLAVVVWLFDLKSGGVASASWILGTRKLDKFCGCNENDEPQRPPQIRGVQK